MLLHDTQVAEGEKKSVKERRAKVWNICHNPKEKVKRQAINTEQVFNEQSGR